MKKIIYIIITVVFAISCTNGQNKDDKKNQKDEAYVIPDSLYSFFPDNSSDNKKNKLSIEVTNAEKTDLPYYKVEFAVKLLAKVYICEDTSYYAKRKDIFISQSINRFKSENTSYLIIGSERDLLEDYDKLELKEKYLNFKDNPLVLNFKEVFYEIPNFQSSSTICGLPEGYEILILKSGNEYVLPEKYKMDWDVLPEELKHGYISGVALKESEGIMIYWVVAW